MSAIMRIRLGVTGRKGHGFGSISLFLLSLTLLSVLGFWGGNGIHPKMAQAASGGDPVLLLAFTSEHCPACQVLEPLISGLESKNYPIRRVSPQNPDDLPYYQQYRIETMPSFVLLVDGKESNRFITNGEGIGVVQTRLLSMFQNAQAELKRKAESTTPNVATLPTPVNANPSTPSTDSPRPDVNSVATSNPVALPDGGEISADAPLSASVRIRIKESGSAIDSGTGTLIHANNANDSREGLILTCGHLFRDSKGNAPVEVDFYDPVTGRSMTVEGECVFYDDDLDIGFVGVPLPFPMTPAKLVPPGYLPRGGDQLVSVGCSSGEDPTVWNHSVLSTDKKFYQPKDANSGNHPFYFIEVSNAPCPGRSGGGLFVRSESGDYELVGVCNAGDPKSDEGYFLPASVVYDQLSANRNLTFVYEDLIRGGRGNVDSELTNPTPLMVSQNNDFRQSGPVTDSKVREEDQNLSSANGNGGIRPVNFEEKDWDNRFLSPPLAEGNGIENGFHGDNALASGNSLTSENVPMEGNSLANGNVLASGDNLGNANALGKGLGEGLTNRTDLTDEDLSRKREFSGNNNVSVNGDVLGKEDAINASLEELRHCHERGAEIICIINWPKTSDSSSKESDVIRFPQP